MSTTEKSTWPTRRRFLAASVVGSSILGLGRPAWAAAPSAAAGVLAQGYGPGLGSLAIARDGKTAYVAFSLSDTLLNIDLTTGEIAGTIDVSSAGFLLQSDRMALSPDGRWLAIFNKGASNVMVIDTAAQSLSKVLTIDTFMGCLGFAPDGRLFAADPHGGFVVTGPPNWPLTHVGPDDMTAFAMWVSQKQSGLLYCLGISAKQTNIFFRFDAARGATDSITPVPLSVWPDQSGPRMAVPAAEDVAYCGWNDPASQDRLRGTMWVLDLRTFKFGSSTLMDYGIADLIVDEPARKVYVAGSWSGGSAPGTIPLVEWDMATQSISNRLWMAPAASTEAVRVDPTNPRYVYSTDGDHNILRRTDALTGAEVMRTRLSSSKVGLQFMIVNGDTALVWCTNHNRNLVRLDLKNGAVTGLLPAPGGEVSGGGYSNGRYYFPAGNNLFVVDAATLTQISKETIETKVNGMLEFSGGKFYNVRQGTSDAPGTQVLQFDATTFKLLRTSTLLPHPGADRVILSPDGTKIYTCNAEIGLTTARLTVLDAETLATRKTIDIPSDWFRGGASNFASWDFDLDNRLLYMAGFNSVYVIDLDRDTILRELVVLDAVKASGKPGGNGGTAISGVHLSPAKDLLMVISSDFSAMYVYDLKRSQWQPRVVSLKGFLPRCSCRSSDRRFVYAPCIMSDSVSQIDATTGNVVKAIPVTAPWTGLSTVAVRHAANYAMGSVSPGQLTAIYAEYIGPNVFTTGAPDASGTYPTQLGGARVLFDGVPAPILYAYTSMIGLIVPYAVAGRASTSVQVEYQGVASNSLSLAVAAATPGIFTADSSGQGPAAALNQDGTFNSAANPEAGGRVVVFYATGAGQTSPAGIDGRLADGPLPLLTQQVQVFIGGVQAEVLYAGPAPGMVAGVVQVNARIPAGVAASAASLVLRVGNASSSSGVTLAVGF